MYTTVTDSRGAVDAATRLAGAAPPLPDGDLRAVLPLLVDRVMAEAGIVEPALTARALAQAAGDLSRAVSLLRAWAANLPRVGRTTAARHDLRVMRRVTPGFRAPRGGQYLGATFDYAQRLLDFGEARSGGLVDLDGTVEDPLPSRADDLVATPPRALADLLDEGLLAPGETARPDDRTRQHLGAGSGRGPLLQHLGRADTGAMTGLAYSSLRGFAGGADPTLVELLRAAAPVRRTNPLTGEEITVGEVTVTTAEIALYRVADGQPDPRLTLGFGATVGEVEVRAIGAALLDGGISRAQASGAPLTPNRGSSADDEEFVLLTLDQSEANGFTEHLKLPHHVTFSSDVDAVRRVRDTLAARDAVADAEGMA